jgi:hypothetical protein
VPQTLIRYKVKPDQVERNLELVRGVYEELAETQPDGLRYATFQLEDGVTFLHVAFVENERSPLPELEAFRRFQADIRERCEEPPVVTDFNEVGSFGLWE